MRALPFSRRTTLQDRDPLRSCQNDGLGSGELGGVAAFELLKGSPRHTDRSGALPACLHDRAADVETQTHTHTHTHIHTRTHTPHTHTRTHTHTHTQARPQTKHSPQLTDD